MFSRPATKKDIKKILGLIDKAQSIAITCHVKPDGDAIGATLALWHILVRLGKKVDVITPDTPPRYLKFLPGTDDIIAYSSNEEFGNEVLSTADLIFCLDFNAAYRVDRMETSLREAPAAKIMIDHHLDPEDFGQIAISEPSDSSTCFLLFKIFCQFGWRQLIDKDTAMCLAAGMMTDTGNFSYNANDPEVYLAMAVLLKTGIDKVGIWERLNVKSENQLRLTGFALEKKLELYDDGHAALIALTTEELDRFKYQKGDLEGLVNVPLQIPAVNISVLMHQEPTFIKVSMRSQGNLAVNTICEKYFSGGGHRNAAGGEFKGTMDDCKKIFLKALDEKQDITI